MSAYLDVYDAVGLASASRPLMQFSSAGLPSKYGSWGLVEYTGEGQGGGGGPRCPIGRLLPCLCRCTMLCYAHAHNRIWAPPRTNPPQQP